MKLLRTICYTLFIFNFIYLAAPVFATESLQGVIQERGRGKFFLEEENGMRRQFYESKKTSVYIPGNWRPKSGDKVNVSFFKKPHRSGTMMLVAAKIELIEGGPLTMNLKSPVEVEILEIGRKFIRVNIIEANQSMQFTKVRKMQMIPTGWVPYGGEKAKIYFHTKPSRFTFNLVYLIDKIEKI